MLKSAVEIIAALAKMGVRLSWRQKRYLKWRESKRGKLYFTAEEENEFYKALEAGNTDVIDTAIYEKQKRIDRLRRSLLKCLVLGCLLVSGCILFRDPPVRDVPPVTVEALTEDERSYVVEDIEVRVSGKLKQLDGQHYIVSPDFIRTFRRNQETTLEALLALQKAKRWMLPIGLGAFALGAIFMRIARR